LVLSCDVGSLPFTGDGRRFLEGAKIAASELRFLISRESPEFSSLKYFEDVVLKGFIDKILELVIEIVCRDKMEPTVFKLVKTCMGFCKDREGAGQTHL